MLHFLKNFYINEVDSGDSVQAALSQSLGKLIVIDTTSDVLLKAMSLSQEDEGDFTDEHCAYILKATAAILVELSKNGSIRAIRTLGLNAPHSIKVGVHTDLGIHWSFSPKRSLGDPPRGSHYATIEALIPNSSIDWVNTLGSLMLSAGGSWYEREITTKRNAPVNVLNVFQDYDPYKGQEWFDTDNFLNKWVKLNPFKRPKTPQA